MDTKKLIDGFQRDERTGLFLGRRFTCDASFGFRMPGGIPGDVSRKHPSTIEPCLTDPTNPPTFFGQGVIVDDTSANGVRVPASGDSGLTAIYGITVRPFPFQTASASNYGAQAFGAAALPAGAVDILRAGYMTVTAQGAAVTYKGAPVHLCIVAGTGYVVGGFSADTVSGTFITLADALWNGPADASGNAEIAFNI
jgi:hypothetical protein